MTTVTSLTSPTPRPGYVLNETGAPRRQEWIDSFVTYWSSQWAHGTEYGVNRFVPEGWVSADFGEPDPADTNGYASPRTLLAFTRYAENYRPGIDPNIDRLMPMPAGRSDDYVEDPVTTATRIANEHWDKTFDYNARQAAESNAINREGIAATREGNAMQYAVGMAGVGAQNYATTMRAKADAAQAFNQAFANELSKFATEAEMFTSAENRKVQEYGINASMYNANEANRASNLQYAGGLSQGLQAIYDARTENAIKLHADPGNFIEREAAVRALNAPQGTTQPGYQNVQSLQDIINRLVNWTPAAQPTPPALAPVAAPVAPTGINPDAQALVNGILSGAESGGGGGSNPYQVDLATLLAMVGRGAAGAGTGAAGAATTPRPATGVTSSTPLTPAAATPAASGWSGIRNEDVAGLTAGQRRLLTTGTTGTSRGSDYIHPGATSYRVYNPNTNAVYGENDEIGAGSPVWVEAYAEGGTGVTDRKMIVGDTVDGAPNPEIVQINNPGPNTTTDVIPINKRGSDPFQQAVGSTVYPDPGPPPPVENFDFAAAAANKRRGTAPNELPAASNGVIDEPVVAPPVQTPAAEPPDMWANQFGPAPQGYNRWQDFMTQSGNMPAWFNGLGAEGQGQQGYHWNDPSWMNMMGQYLRQYQDPAWLNRVGPAQAQDAVRAFATGTAGQPQEPPNVNLTSYPDEVYQNYPTLQYMQGRMRPTAYNTLSTGYATGAYGAQLPESGRINYGKYLRVEKDPISLALLSSSYRSGSRDLFSEVARAKARAPFGQSVQTSLIRT